MREEIKERLDQELKRAEAHEKMKELQADKDLKLSQIKSIWYEIHQIDLKINLLENS